VIGKELHDLVIVPENMYNMDETGVMLCKLNSVKVVVGKDDLRGYRGAEVNREQITAIECVSGDGKLLHPMIVWPASSHRAKWTTYRTPGWHYAYSETGYTDSEISLEWLKCVFDPQTKARAQQKPRLLIVDGFITHETVEAIQYCLENNIILCRIPSHTSHKLQPCDVGVFSPLKTAYRERVERLYRGGVAKVGKEHFASLYSRAREVAFTPRNIRAGWNKTGLIPFNPDRVLSETPKPPDESSILKREVTVVPRLKDVPHTPMTSEALTSLCRQAKADKKKRGRKAKGPAEGEEATAGKKPRGRKRKSLASEADTARSGSAKVARVSDASEPKAPVACMSEAQDPASASMTRLTEAQELAVQALTARMTEAQVAEDEIATRGMEKYCSVLSHGS
jgi:hypothetical protein